MAFLEDQGTVSSSCLSQYTGDQSQCRESGLSRWTRSSGSLGWRTLGVLSVSKLNHLLLQVPSLSMGCGMLGFFPRKQKIDCLLHECAEIGLFLRLWASVFLSVEANYIQELWLLKVSRKDPLRLKREE